MEVVIKFDGHNMKEISLMSLLEGAGGRSITDLPLNLTLTTKGIKLEKTSFPQIEMESECVDTYDFKEEVKEIGNDMYESDEIEDYAREYCDYDMDGVSWPNGISVSFDAIEDPIKDDWVEYEVFHLEDCIEAFGIEDVVERVNEVIDFICIDSFEVIDFDADKSIATVKVDIRVA